MSENFFTTNNCICAYYFCLFSRGIKIIVVVLLLINVLGFILFHNLFLLWNLHVRAVLYFISVYLSQKVLLILYIHTNPGKLIVLLFKYLFYSMMLLNFRVTDINNIYLSYLFNSFRESVACRPAKSSSLTAKHSNIRHLGHSTPRLANSRLASHNF